MNRLYVIRWLLPNGYEISRSSFWVKELAEELMSKNPEWKFELVEANDTHMIWEAR